MWSSAVIHTKRRNSWRGLLILICGALVWIRSLGTNNASKWSLFHCERTSTLEDFNGFPRMKDIKWPFLKRRWTSKGIGEGLRSSFIYMYKATNKSKPKTLRVFWANQWVQLGSLVLLIDPRSPSKLPIRRCYRYFLCHIAWCLWKVITAQIKVTNKNGKIC